MTDLYFPWETAYRPSPLCLKERGAGAVVVRVAPRSELGPRVHRMYEAWLSKDGVPVRKVYDPADEYKVGQFVRAG